MYHRPVVKPLGDVEARNRSASPPAPAPAVLGPIRRLVTASRGGASAPLVSWAEVRPVGMVQLVRPVANFGFSTRLVWMVRLVTVSPSRYVRSLPNSASESVMMTPPVLIEKTPPRMVSGALPGTDRVSTPFPAGAPWALIRTRPRTASGCADRAWVIGYATFDPVT